MPSDDASRVFERFWRSDPSRTRASGGAGLGLAIVAAIADAHGGRAEVQSAAGRGSTFRVHLPLTVPIDARDGGPRRRRTRADPQVDADDDPASPTSKSPDPLVQADDELAEVLAREEAHERLGRAVDARRARAPGA